MWILCIYIYIYIYIYTHRERSRCIPAVAAAGRLGSPVVYL